MRNQIVISSIMLVFFLIPNLCLPQWRETNGPVIVGSAFWSFAREGDTLLSGGTGVYRSSDGGSSWKDLGLTLSGTSVGNALLMKGSTIFAGTGGAGLYISTDNGNTWKPSNPGLITGDITALLALDSLVFVATTGSSIGIYVSSNNGLSWARSDYGIDFGEAMSMVAEGNFLFASSVQEIFRSSDRGASWTVCYVDSNGQTPLSLAASGSNIMAATFHGLYCSTDQGQHWFQPDSKIANFPFRCLAAEGSDVLAGSMTSGVYYSSDEGISWSSRTTGIPNLYITSVFFDGSTLFAASNGQGIYRSTDNGLIWQAVNSGLSSMNSRSLVHTDNSIFAEMDYDDVLTTSDDGSHWTIVSNGISYQIYTLLAHNSNLFAGSDIGVYFSSDHGVSWTNRASGMLHNTQRVYALYSSGANIYAGTNGAGVYISTNEGLSWNVIDTGLTSMSVRSLSGSDSLIFAGTTNGIFMSSNAGANWHEIDTGFAPKATFFLHYRAPDLFVGTLSQSLRTTNKGAAWDTITFDTSLQLMRSLADYRGSIFAGAAPKGVYLSNDNGASWSSVGRDLGTRSVNDLLVEGFTLFAATSNGVWQRPLVEMVPLDTIRYTFHPGWNMISLPYVVQSYSTRALFPSTASKAFGFSGSYAIESSLDNESGYWIKMDSSSTLAVQGLPISSDSISVAPRWNMIGTVSNPILVNGISSVPPGVITSPFFTYNGSSYIIVDTLKPGAGYWVKAAEAGHLILSSVNAQMPKGGLSNRIHIKPTNELPPPPPDERSVPAPTIPKDFALSQSYPNPFNPSTTIHFEMPKASHVRLAVFDLLGQEVLNVLDENKPAGVYDVKVNARNLSSGIYFYRLVAGDFIQTKKMVLMK